MSSQFCVKNSVWDVWLLFVRALHYGIPHLTSLHTVVCYCILLWITRSSEISGAFQRSIISQSLISLLSLRFHRDEHESDVSLPVRLGQAEARIKALQSCKIRIKQWGHPRLDMRSEVNNGGRFSVSQRSTRPERSSRSWGVNTTKKWWKSKTLIHCGHTTLMFVVFSDVHFQFLWFHLKTRVCFVIANNRNRASFFPSVTVTCWFTHTKPTFPFNSHLKGHLSDPS